MAARFSTTPVRIAEGLNEEGAVDVHAELRSSAFRSILAVTVSTNAAPPPNDDGFIATFVVECPHPILMAMVANAVEASVVDAGEHFFVVLGTKGEGELRANEAPVHLYAKTHDHDLLFSCINTETFTFNLVAATS